MSGEKTQYSSSILVAQKPIDATEIIRVRLSQAKLLNDEFSSFFKRYYTIKSNYTSELNKLVTESQDLNRNIEAAIIKNNVLSPEELKHYNVDAIGHLSEIWSKVVQEIKDEVSANNSLRQVVDRELVVPLNHFTSKNRQWSEIRDLHTKLSEVAQNIEFNQEKIEKYNENPAKHGEKLQKYEGALQSSNSKWDFEAPYVFEVFENTDFARLSFLRDSLLRFITAYTDSLNKISKSNEATLETILNFNPETEISRFAKVSSEAQNIPKEARRAAESPVAHSKSTFATPSAAPTNNGFRSASVATTATSNTFDSAVTDSKPLKQKTKLRSKVGSIFGRKKKDKKRSTLSDAALPESETSSLREAQTPTGRSRQSSFASNLGGLRGQTTGTNLSQSQLRGGDTADEEDNLYGSRSNDIGNSNNGSRGSSNIPKPIDKNSPSKYGRTPVATAAVSSVPASVPTSSSSGSTRGAPISLNQAPLQPTFKSTNSSNSFNNNVTPPALGDRRVSDASFSDNSSNINVQPSQYSNSQDSHQTHQSEVRSVDTNGQTHDSYHHAPQPPPSRKTGHFGSQNLANIHENDSFSFARNQQPQQQHSFPPPPPPSQQQQQRVARRDIQSGLFTNLNQADLENNQNKRISSFNSFASEPARQQLRPQITGSSLGGVGGGLFHHPDLTQPGLNASVAEVINAKFKDGEQVSSQIIGEIAFNYRTDGTVPTRTSVQISGSERFDKTIPNPQFLKQIDQNEFEINPSFILSRTLGGLKYSIKDQRAPITVLPVWRIEPHQASLMLSIKLNQEIASHLRTGEKVELNDVVVSVSVNGATTSALSKPQGTFNKDKSRITWRFNKPIVLGSTDEEKIVARFITPTQVKESDQGVAIKFSVHDNGGSKYVSTGIRLESQNFTEDDPFAQETWNAVPTFTTLVAGNYTGSS